MAIVCISKITPVDVAAKIVTVSADITVDDGPTHTVTVRKADISTNSKKVDVADTVWRKFLDKYSKQLADESIASEIDDLQNMLNLNIQGRTI